MQTPKWKPLKEFPNYSCNKEGQIKNRRTDKVIKTQIGIRGQEYVALQKNGKQYSRSVRKLVFDTFGNQDI